MHALLAVTVVTLLYLAREMSLYGTLSRRKVCDVQGVNIALEGANTFLLTLVIWQFNHCTPHSRLIHHPTRNAFALISTSSTSEAGSPISYPSSTCRVFNIRSPTPIQTHTLPFQLIQAAWLGPKRSAGFSLVGITSTWAAVLVGDEDIHTIAPTTEGSVGQSGLSTLSGGEVRRTTLFEDIFGDGALVNPADALVASASTSQIVGTRKVPLPLEVFDGPAHMLPPIVSLFSTLIGSFLQPKTSSEGTDSGHSAKGKERETVYDEADEFEEDVEMEDGTGGIHVGSSAERVVSEQEMNLFTDLFRTQLISGAGAYLPVSLLMCCLYLPCSFLTHEAESPSKSHEWGTPNPHQRRPVHH